MGEEYQYIYDSEGRCVEIITDRGSLKSFTWDGDNLASMTYTGSSYDSVIFSAVSPRVARPVAYVSTQVAAWHTMYAGRMNVPVEACFASLMEGSHNLIAEERYEDYGVMCSDYFTITSDDDGYPVEIIQYNDDMTPWETFTFEWETTPAGIDWIPADDDSGGEQYFSIDGRRLNSPQRGMTIVRHTDGTTTKLMIR